MPESSAPRLAATPHCRPYVREELDAVSLHFSMAQTQSRMRLQHPDVLEFEYTCLMLGFLLWRPQARRLAMLGLGGGSIVKFCHRQLPLSSMVVVEINPHVIELREVFRVPPDDARLRVVAQDGARFVAETMLRFDVLMVDAFDAQGMPAAFGTRRFYDDCLDVLEPGGVLVANLHAGDPWLEVYLERIRHSFGGEVLRVDDTDGANAIVFAVKPGPGAGLSRPAVRRPAPLGDGGWVQLQAAFERIGAAARGLPARGGRP